MDQSAKYRKYLAATVTTALVATSAASFVPVVSASTTGFQDVQTNKFYTEAVEKMSSVGFIQGVSGTKFGTNEPLKRKDAAVLFSRVLLWDVSQVGSIGFSDVPRDSYYYNAVAQAAKMNLISGKSTTHFAPDAPLTRGEMAVLLTRALNLQVDTNAKAPFVDIKGHPYEKEMTAVYQAGLTSGKTATTFDPAGTVSRAEFATFLYRSELVREHIEVKQQNQTGTVLKVNALTDTSVTLGGATYQLSDDVKKIFNKENEKMLANAYVSIKQANQVITEITYLAIASGGELNGNGVEIRGNVAVLADHVTLENATITGNLTIGKQAKESFTGKKLEVKGETKVVGAEGEVSVKDATGARITFVDSFLRSLQSFRTGANLNLTGSSSVTSLGIYGNNMSVSSQTTIPTLTTGANVRGLSIGANTRITKLVLPPTEEARNVIADYDKVKDNIEQVSDKANPDAPPAAGGGGGGGGGGSTPVLVNLEIQKVAGQGNEAKFKMTSKDYTPTFAQGEVDLLKADGKSAGSKAITGSHFTYEVVLDSATEAGDQITIEADEDGVVSIRVNDSGKNGTLNGIHTLKVKDTKKNIVRELNFTVTYHWDDGDQPEQKVSSILPLPQKRLTVTSAFNNGGRMNDKYASKDYGGNVGTSIPLTWAIEAAPEGHSYFVIMFDPTSGTVHWAVKDIPNTVQGLAEGASGNTNEIKGEEFEEYWGPIPPMGIDFMPDEHRYVTEVFLLNTATIDTSDLITIVPDFGWELKEYDYDKLRGKIDNHVVGYGKVTGTYSQPDDPSFTVPTLHIMNDTLTDSSVQLSFQPVDAADSVWLEESTDGGSTWNDSETGLLDRNSSLATVTGLTANTEYKFRLVARKGPIFRMSEILTVMTKPGPLIIEEASTFDDDADGIVDSYLIRTNRPINDSSVNIADFKIEGVTATSFYTGNGPNDRYFWINFEENNHATDALPKLTVAAGAFKDTDGVINREVTGTDDVEADGADPIVFFDPDEGATDVAVDGSITITFSEAVRLLNDSPVTEADLAAMISLKETDATGEVVTFTATIDPAMKVITITPSDPLKNQQVYYVRISGQLEDASDNSIAATSITFTTEN